MPARQFRLGVCPLMVGRIRIEANPRKKCERIFTLAIEQVLPTTTHEIITRRGLPLNDKFGVSEDEECAYFTVF